MSGMDLKFSNPRRWNELVDKFYDNTLTLEETRELSKLVNRELAARPRPGGWTEEVRSLILLRSALRGTEILLTDEIDLAS